MAKSNVIVLKNARNLVGLVRKFIFVIIYTWCVDHAVHYVLQLGKSSEPKWPKISFLVSGLRPQGQDIFIFKMILIKMRSYL